MRILFNTILFDLDGVLIDACNWHRDALNKALVEYMQQSIPIEDHNKIYNGLPTKVKLKKLLDEGKLDSKEIIDPIAEKKQEFFKEIALEMAHYNEPLINRLKTLKMSGITIGCVTNSVRETTDLMLSRIGIRHLMDVVITNQDVSNPKPHPEPYVAAMIELGSKPRMTIAIEDTDKGEESAKFAGVRRIIRVEDHNDMMNLRTWDIIQTGHIE